MLGLTFEDDVVDDAVVGRFEALIEAASTALWQASEGQVYIGRCVVAERAGWGQVCVPLGALELEALDSGAAFELSSPGTEAWRILSPGRPADDQHTALLCAANIARGVFGLDEHGASADAAEVVAGPGCLLAGTATRLCAEHDEPRLARRACRSVIDERWLGLATFPNPGWSPDEPTPPTAFERLRQTP